MIESKAWNWEVVSKDDDYWNTPDSIMYYLQKTWSDLKYKLFLDIGCGFGRHCVFMAKNNFDVSGFDLSQHSVDVTNEKLKENNTKAKITVADMLEFPYENNSFDCMLALNVINHTDTNGLKKILGEIYRCLKPNGEVYLTLGSKDTFGYKNPDNIVVDANTRIKVEDGPENGVPHFYIDDEDCKTMFNNFTLISVQNIRELTMYGSWSSHYHLHLKKSINSKSNNEIKHRDYGA